MFVIIIVLGDSRFRRRLRISEEKLLISDSKITTYYLSLHNFFRDKKRAVNIAYIRCEKVWYGRKKGPAQLRNYGELVRKN